MSAMSVPRQLVVNADDFGLTPGINRGIIRAHRDGIVTSASLMVRGPAAAEAAAWARANPALSVGLHLDLAEWEFRDGEWRARYTVVDTSDADAVAAEVERQLGAFRALMGRDPTHVDSHQHVHRSEPVRSAARRLARGLGVVLRGDDAGVRYRGDFYGQGTRGDPCHECISPAALVRLVGTLEPGVTEMGCHPGEDDDADSVYRTERGAEVAALCDPRVRAALEASGVGLVSFAGIRGMPPDGREG